MIIDFGRVGVDYYGHPVAWTWSVSPVFPSLPLRVGRATIGRQTGGQAIRSHRGEQTMAQPQKGAVQ